ncbi:MAG: hypothetical protein NTV88_02360, partial [Candidatus Micrarchaeota archaeon]|nr:hypothetical protein [Candidatus Micrarchaeota archaeon]
MFLFQVAHKHGSKKAPAVYAMLSDDAEKTVRSNFTKCQDISGSDMQATFDKYGVNKKDKKEMLKLIGELFAKNSEMVKILDEGNGVKAPEKYFDDYCANVKKWNDLVTKYGVSEWAQPEIVYFSSTKIDEIVVTADGPSNKKTSDDWYNTTGTVSGNYGKFGSYLDRISGGEWPDELKDVSLAKELVKYAIDNGRKEEAAQLISKYLDEFIASGDTKFFDDIFNKNPELKMQVLASRRDLSNYANYLSLMCKSLNVTIQDKSEDILLANPWINSLVMPGDREAAVVFMGALSALSNLGNKMNKFCEEFGRDFSMAVNRDFLVGGAGTVLTYLDKFLWGVHDELRSVFGFEASDNLTEANKNLTNSSSNVLLAIKQAEMSGYTFTTEMGLNLLCMVAPEFKFGSFAPKVASEFVKKEFAMGIFTDMVEFYMKEGYTREAAVEMAGNEFSSLSKTRVFDLVESSPKALW